MDLYFLYTNFKDFTWLFWTEVLGKVQNLNTNVLSNWSACQSFVWPQSHCHHHGLHRVTEIELPHHVDHLCHKSLKPALLPNCTCISHTIFEFVNWIVYSLSMVYCRRKISSWWTSPSQNYTTVRCITLLYIVQGPVDQRVNMAIQWLNLYPVDKCKQNILC